jgi:hypothetical protein
MNWAIPEAVAAIPPKPSTAAINATIKNPSGQRSKIPPDKREERTEVVS